MKNSKQLREEIGALADKVKAVAALADEQKRSMNEAEQKEVDGHLASSEALKAELVRAERIEKLEEEFAAKRTGNIPGTQSTEPTLEVEKPEASRASLVRIPAASRFRYGKLVAYKGEHAEQRAYLAGRFLMGSLFKDTASIKWCQDHGLDMTYRAAMKESANELGGWMVPEEMEQAIIDLKEIYGVFRQEAKVTPMLSDTKRVPRRTGGVTAYFGDELGTMTASDKAWDGVQLGCEKAVRSVPLQQRVERRRGDLDRRRSDQRNRLRVHRQGRSMRFRGRWH
jgi:HK97 family phage major capsid protein